MTTESRDPGLDGSSLPAGWELVERNEDRNGLVLRFVRSRHGEPALHWVTAFGATLDDAMASGRVRMEFFDEIDRDWERHRAG